MIKLSKLTDYGFVLLTQFAGDTQKSQHTARDLADATGLPLPTVSKLLKTLGRNGLLSAHRGARGGYSLSRQPDSITASDIIEAIDGPIAFTDCVCGTQPDACAIEGHCPTKSHWVRITHTVREALDRVTLAELAKPVVADGKNFRNGGSGCQDSLCNSVPGKACTCGDHQHITGEIRK